MSSAGALDMEEGGVLAQLAREEAAAARVLAAVDPQAERLPPLALAAVALPLLALARDGGR